MVGRVVVVLRIIIYIFCYVVGQKPHLLALLLELVFVFVGAKPCFTFASIRSEIDCYLSAESFVCFICSCSH